MNMNDIAWHLQNFADTWSGWYNVLRSIAQLVSTEFNQHLNTLVDQFQPEGLLNPANNENKELSSFLSSNQPKLDEDGKYIWNGLSSFGSPRN